MGSGSFKLAMVSLAAALAMPLNAIAQTGGAQPATNGTPQVEQPDSGGVNWKGAGVGAATLLANVGYIPAKTVYAIVGGITGGVGYALTGGNQQVGNSIWRSSLGGDYVLTPDMVSGQTPIHFSGPSTPPPAATPPYTGSPSSSAASTQQFSSNIPPPAPAGSAVYPNAPASTGSSSGVGAPPYSASSSHSGGYSSSPIGPTHITTSVVSEPADSGSGPVRGRDVE
jgi:hypothetical protein